MATDKKSFLLYCDLIHTVSKMPKEKAGELFMHILQYVNDEEPITEDLIIQLTFEPIKQSLKRDLAKWEGSSSQRIEKARLAGLASAEARRLKKQLDSTNELEIQLNPTKPTVSVSVSVSDNVNVKETNNIDSRKLKFAHTLTEFANIYDRQLLKDFYDYWTETNDGGKKFRREMQKSWSLNLRLKKWESNNKNFNNGKQQITSTDEFKNIVTAIRSDGVRR
jgi:hypothetical protein